MKFKNVEVLIFNKKDSKDRIIRDVVTRESYDILENDSPVHVHPYGVVSNIRKVEEEVIDIITEEVEGENGEMMKVRKDVKIKGVKLVVDVDVYDKFKDKMLGYKDASGNKVQGFLELSMRVHPFLKLVDWEKRTDGIKDIRMAAVTGFFFGQQVLDSNLRPLDKGVEKKKVKVDEEE